MKRFTDKILAVLLFLANVSSVNGQYKVADSDHLVLKYPNSNQVMLYMNKTYTVTRSKSGVDVQLSVTEDRLITKSGQFGANSEELQTNESFMDLIDFEASSLLPVDGKYKEQQVKKFFLNDEFEHSFFTNDNKTKQFYFPNTDAGVITHLAYTIAFKDPYFLPSVFTQSYYPIEKFVLRYVVDNDVDLEMVYFNLSEDTLKFSRTVGKKTTEYLWNFESIPAMKYFSGAPNIRWFLPHILFKIKGHKIDNGYEKMLGNTDDLYSLYKSWIDKIEKEDPASVKIVVDEIVRGAETDLEKLDRIYHWVQDHIKYIAFTTGMEGLVPRTASNVLSCRFGDCKGMTNLMYNMAAAAGVSTQRTWIGTRDLPYTYDEVGSPSVDNHMILSYVSEDTVIFMDATNSEIPFGYPSEFIQGKQALVGLDSANYRLITVPSVGAERNQWLDTVFIKIEGQNIVGEGHARFSGYHSSSWQRRLKNVEDEKIQEFYSNYFQKGDNRFTLSNLKYEVSESREFVDIRYDFLIPKYVTLNGEDLIVNLNLERAFGESPFDEERNIPYETSYNSSVNHIVVLDLGDELSAKFVPENSQFDDDEFGYTMTYTKDKQKIIFSLNTRIESLIMFPESFDRWNKLSSQFRKDTRKNIVLKKNQ